MRASRAAVPALACLVTGGALYLSRGVLDFGLGPDGPVRLALLPPLISFLGFVVLAGIGLLWLDHLNRPRGTTTGRRPGLASLVLPTFALAVMALPFLPWVPDRWGLLTLPAGPAGGLVWLLVLTSLLWAAWHSRLWRVPRVDGRPLAQLTAAIGVATFLISGTAAARLTDTVLFPAGDEPHYLVIAQSLWRDGDLAIENNHARGDYREYFQQPLEPHYLTRGADGEIYSVHPVGLPVLLAPVYAAGGYHLVVLLLLALSSLAAALMWRAAALSAGPGPATFGWAVVATSAPFALNAFTVYPEMTAGLAAVVAITLATGGNRGARVMAGTGIAAGVLPWLSTKYAPMSAALMAVAFLRIWIPGRSRTAVASDTVRATAALVAPYAALLAAWFAFFYIYWGTPWPQAPYGSMTQTSPANLVFGAPGLLFDQEYGLFAYAPAYLLAAAGLWRMWRAGGDTARRAVEIAVVFGALLGTVGAFRIWWGGSASPSRPLGSGLLLLVPPIAAAYRATRGGTPRRAAQHLLLAVGAGFAVLLTFAEQGLLIANDRDGTSRLLEYLSPDWHAWTLLPTFIHHEAGTALVHSAAWIAVLVAAWWVLGRLRPATPGGAALGALAVAGATVVAVGALAPLLPDDPPLPGRDLSARSRLEALDRFDTTALPVGIVFDPVRAAGPAGVEAFLALEAAPGTRTDPQPVRVLHNGRFSLPAGDYRVRVTWSDEAPAAAGGAPLSLQVGRIGPPVETWTVTPARGQSWDADFSLPADASFVGFRGSVDLERVIRSIRVTPTRVVDAAHRPITPVVLAARRYGETTVLFHDEQTYPEADGFWTIGRRRTELTIAPPPGDERPVSLTIHSGPHPNHVVLEAHGWRRELDLAPSTPVDVELPPPTRGVIEIAMSSADGFVPASAEAASTDTRLLGAWVAVTPRP
ncbi:MAG: hypothetical protein AB7H88_12170 [Vicinamibacterales bacterium]